MHKHDRERDRQADHGMVTVIAIGKITCQRCKLIIIIVIIGMFMTQKCLRCQLVGIQTAVKDIT